VSNEIVTGRDGRIYVIVGGPHEGYDVHVVGDEPIARYDRKSDARKDLMHGRLSLDALTITIGEEEP
jgi:hypothetical protein